MKRLFTFLLMTAGFATTAIAQTGVNMAGLTIPQKPFTATINFDDAPERINDKFPLSDQNNEGGWKLLKKDSEEFSGKELDSKKWYPNNPKWKGRQPTYFHDNNFKQRDGYGVFMINQHGDEELPEGFTHSAGFIVSKKKYLYGYFEAALSPNDSPWITGFWMVNNSTPGWRTEIDICENCPFTPGLENALSSNIHVFQSPKEHGDIKEHISYEAKYKIPYDVGEGFHVWGMDWSKEYIRLYFDGVLYREIKNDYWHQELQINLNNESNYWFGAVPDGDLGVDEEYLVDYVRIWQKR